MKRRRLMLITLAALTLVSACGAKAYMNSRLPDGVQVVAYDPARNYMADMIECAKDGSEYALYIGAICEEQRNMKLEYMEIDEEKTQFFVSANPSDVRVAMGLEEPARYYTDDDVLMLAKVMYTEARGISSETELSCVAWTILNRLDNGGYGDSISDVVLAPNQFAYNPYAPTVNDYGVNLAVLAQDVLERWSREKNGESDVGRTLPSSYMWYAGDGKHNYFRDAFKGGTRWNYSLPSPYDS